MSADSRTLCLPPVAGSASRALACAAGVLAAVALGGGALGQQRTEAFLPLGREHILLQPNGAAWVGDVDRDGDPDLVTSRSLPGQNGHRIGVLLNDGRGRFQSMCCGPPVGSQGVLVDLDGDGDLDLTTLAGSSGTNRLFLNDGRGGFVDATLGRLPPVLSSSDLGDVVAADVDRDGDLDLMVSRGYFQNPETVVLLLNDGTARFTEAPDRMPGTRLFDRLAVADVDQDADPDLIAGGFLFINDGRGFFRDETTTRWPGRWLGRYSPQDVDGDGDVDVLGIGGSEAWLLLNDGRGNFADGSAGRLPGRLFPEAWIDVDLDGDPDLLFGDVLYLNDGRGAFSAAPVPRIPPLCRGFADTAVDVDGDGDRDLVGTRLLLNDGRGLFHDATAESCLGPYPTYQPDKALAGDLDTDGRVDQVILCGNEAARLYLQDASGSFQEQTLARLPAGLGYVRTGDLGDVDGDLDLDLVLVGQRMTVLLNDGTGRFVDGGPTRLPVASTTLDVRLADVDGDGDPDLLFGSNGVGPTLLVNDGQGFFAADPARLPPLTALPAATAVGDVDGDRDRDLVLAFNGTPGRLLLNDGRGFFTEGTAGRLDTGPLGANTVLLADLDRDQYLDLMVGAGNRDSRLFLNDGSGRFTDVTASHLPPRPSSIWSMVAGDLDEDGDVDLVVADFRQDVLIYRNDGAARFTDVTAAWKPAGPVGATHLILQDFDHDGDLDLQVHGAFYVEELYWNLTRHARAPFLAQSGLPWVIEVFARPGAVPATPVVLPLVSARLLARPVELPPFGRLALDPGLWFPLQPLSIPPGTGVGRVTLLVPTDPVLLGRDVHAQMLLIPASGAMDARFTAVVSDRILR